MYKFKYARLTDIGRLYGVSRNRVGGWLKDAGLRDEDGRPTNQGLTMTTERIVPNGYTTFHVWHVKQTVALLDSLGYRRKSTSAGAGGPR